MRNFFEEYFLEDFWSEKFFCRNFLEGIFCLHRQSYLTMKGIDLFIKILVFVKILSQGRRKE